ncbi:MAG: hypothetical protein V4544_06870 [Pseudomonadota bacterium]
MINMKPDTYVWPANPIIDEQTNHFIYKAGYTELSSYCKGLVSTTELTDTNDSGRVDRVSSLINSMRLGLGFVLEDIEDIERRITT